MSYDQLQKKAEEEEEAALAEEQALRAEEDMAMKKNEALLLMAEQDVVTMGQSPSMFSGMSYEMRPCGEYVPDDYNDRVSTRSEGGDSVLGDCKGRPNGKVCGRKLPPGCYWTDRPGGSGLTNDRLTGRCADRVREVAELITNTMAWHRQGRTGADQEETQQIQQMQQRAAAAGAADNTSFEIVLILQHKFRIVIDSKGEVGFPVTPSPVQSSPV
ncbi:hypothetical protein Pcinc_041075 [Petrolisthes cinctipes]|uniref:Uncharacterized protein n=1 Tax=Petrolisthes cinctipes TaxID=88211 RepID=A0AAE1BNE5_PETCI|nr:hypothetical protein Pcinc_041075 [Petrolisthes cinctipes]